MHRALFYARFSSDRQNDRSVDDQLRLCRDRAQQDGCSIGTDFADYAISGAVRQRPGLNALLAEARRGDRIYAESLDRLSRDQEDIAGIFKRLAFAGATIVTLADGEVSEMHIGFKGTMAALYLKDLGEKTRRGQIGNVHAGKVAGGRSYGYRPVYAVDDRGQVERGRMVIDEDQAAIIRRIFTAFIGGASPRAIAAALNADQVPSPRGGLWRASTINGSAARATGILRNPLYVGRILFNRLRFEKDPDTRRRVSRSNPTEAHVHGDAPDLRIIGDDLWEAAQLRLREFGGGRPQQHRRPVRLLSGLIKCGLCGGRVNVVGAERWGCATYRDTATCSNGRTISTRQLERRVLGAMKAHLVTPAFVEAYLDEWRVGLDEQRKTRSTDAARLQRARGQLSAQLDRLIDAIADGIGDVGRIKGRIREAERELRDIDAAIAELPMIDDIVLHPGLPAMYRQYVEQLEDRLGQEDADFDGVRQALRAMIGQVVMTPNDQGRGAALELHGTFAAVLAAAAAPQGDDCMLTVVAGAGFEPATFRL